MAVSTLSPGRSHRCRILVNDRGRVTVIELGPKATARVGVAVRSSVTVWDTVQNFVLRVTLKVQIRRVTVRVRDRYRFFRNVSSGNRIRDRPRFLPIVWFPRPNVASPKSDTAAYAHRRSYVTAPY